MISLSEAHEKAMHEMIRGYIDDDFGAGEYYFLDNDMRFCEEPTKVGPFPTLPDAVVAIYKTGDFGHEFYIFSLQDGIYEFIISVRFSNI